MNINYFFSLSAIFAVIIVPICFLFLIIRRNNKLSKELGLKPVYQENCGGVFDGMDYTKPFVRLTIYNDFLVISYIKKILLYWSDIKDVSVYTGLFSKGVKIIHNRSNIPTSIILWPNNAARLQEILKSKMI